jgi:cyclopropane fatty-acyl-phospholipid synthase-like methyltransferase
MQTNRHTQKVRSYYNQNTRWFQLFGKTGGTRNIHASLWAEGVRTEAEASSYSNACVVREAESLARPDARLLDLGCGIGGTLAYLAGRLPDEVTFRGVTLSERQAAAAAQLLAPFGTRCRVIVGDFHHLPGEWAESVDLAWALEAFVHSATPVDFLREAYRVLRPGGRLVLIDTFPRTDEEELPDAEKRYLRDYRTCWGAGHTLTLPQCRALAESLGFRLASYRDLTDAVARGRRRDHLIALTTKLFGPLMPYQGYLRALRGGNAVQRGFAQHWLGYCLITLEKPTP